MGSLRRQAVAGSAMSYLASVWNIVLGVARSVILARLVAPDAFGWVALAAIAVQIKEQLLQAGLHQAIIQRPQSDSSVQSTYMTLVLACETLGLCLLLVCGALLGRFDSGLKDLSTILMVLGLGSFANGLATLQITLTQRELRFGRLASIDALSGVVTTVVAVTLAYRGWGCWALVGERVAEAMSRFLLAWGPVRCWNPSLGWHREAAREIGDYCRRYWPGQILRLVLEYFDDLWTGTQLGASSLGFYNKAYEFSRYPRRGFAYPLLPVLAPVFAKLQSDREKLSEALSASLFVVARATVLAAGLMALAMPEVIAYVLGPRWQPMLLPFRILLGYMVLDSMILVLVIFFNSVGAPQVVTRFRAIQVLFFVPAVVVCTHSFGIAGTAAAATMMRALGFVLAMRALPGKVSLSMGTVALRPFVVLALGLTAGLYWEVTGAWLKLVVFVGIFGGLLLLMEGSEYRRQWGEMRRLLSRRRMSE